jgi:hypothetical protein
VIFDELASERLFEPERPRGVDEPQPLPVAGDPLDLTRYDHLATNTAKVHAADVAIRQPPQDPRWIPASVVDEHGRLS